MNHLKADSLNDYLSMNRRTRSSAVYGSSASDLSHNETAKDMIISMDNSSSQSHRPANLGMFHHSTALTSNHTILSSATKKVRDIDLINKKSVFPTAACNVAAQSLILYDKQSFRKNRSMFSCLLVQQYFVYFVLCALIVMCSFGFYYVILMTNLRIESLESNLMDKLENKIQIRIISAKDYLAELKQNDHLNRNSFYVYSGNNNFFDQIDNEKSKDPNIPNYYVMKQLNKTDFILFPAHFNPTHNVKSLNRYCANSKEYCVNLFNKKRQTSTKPSFSELIKPKNSNNLGSKEAVPMIFTDSSPNLTASFNFYMNSKINEDDLSTNIFDLSTAESSSSISSNTSHRSSMQPTTLLTKTSTSTKSVLYQQELKEPKQGLTTTELITNQINAGTRLRNNRHRTDFGSEVSLAASTSAISYTIPDDKMARFLSLNERTCSLYQIASEPNHVVFMGVFHCTWMNNIGGSMSDSQTSGDQYKDYYYLTKSYKGSTVTLCQNKEELRSSRCYKHLPLKYSYYGTGHAIYKDYMFYSQDSSRFLISHSLRAFKSSSGEENDAETRQISMPEDAACCDLRNHLYSVKHSGFFDFEIDENGLWLIYKQEKKSSTNKSEFRYSDAEEDVYVVAKIDENDYKSLTIEKKWYLKLKHNSVANMFVACGQLYALKNTASSPATIYKLCDLLNDYDCSQSSSENESFNITISSRQLTSLSYNFEKNSLYMVDGGSFVFYDLDTVKI